MRYLRKKKVAALDHVRPHVFKKKVWGPGLGNIGVNQSINLKEVCTLITGSQVLNLDSKV